MCGSVLRARLQPDEKGGWVVGGGVVIVLLER